MSHVFSIRLLPWFFGTMLTLLSLLVSLLHGHQRREVSLIVGQDQRGAVAAARRHLQRQIEPSERDGSKCWNSVRTPTLVSVFLLMLLHCRRWRQDGVYLLLLSLWASCRPPLQSACVTRGPAQTHGTPPDSHRPDPLSYPPCGKKTHSTEGSWDTMTISWIDTDW